VAVADALVIKVTAGLDAPERCNQAFTVAATACAAGVPVELWLTGEAAWFALPGRASELVLAYAAPLPDLLATVVETAASSSARSAPAGAGSPRGRDPRHRDRGRVAVHRGRDARRDGVARLLTGCPARRQWAVRGPRSRAAAGRARSRGKPNAAFRNAATNASVPPTSTPASTPASSATSPAPATTKADGLREPRRRRVLELAGGPSRGRTSVR
jgi:hypothetical protein